MKGAVPNSGIQAGTEKLGTVSTCPNCGSFGVKITAGEEFSLEAIDVE